MKMGERVIFRAPRWWVTALENEAKRRAISTSAFIRQAVVHELDRSNGGANKENANGDEKK